MNNSVPSPSAPSATPIVMKIPLQRDSEFEKSLRSWQQVKLHRCQTTDNLVQMTLAKYPTIQTYLANREDIMELMVLQLDEESSDMIVLNALAETRGNNSTSVSFGKISGLRQTSRNQLLGMYIDLGKATFGDAKFMAAYNKEYGKISSQMPSRQQSMARSRQHSVFDMLQNKLPPPEELKRKLACICAIGFMAGAMCANSVGFSKMRINHQVSGDRRICAGPGYESAIAWVEYGLLWANVGFAFFVLSRVYRLHKNIVDGVFIAFLLFELAYHGLVVAGTFYCGNVIQYVQESFEEYLSYPLTTLIVAAARYDKHKHLHMETLCLLSAVLVGEIIQTQYLEHHIEGDLIIIYFNVKLGLVIFEAYLDREWTKVFNIYNFDDNNALLFIAFIGSRLVKQFYYTTPSVIKYQNGLKGPYMGMIWIGATVEVICLFIMLALVVKRNHESDKENGPHEQETDMFSFGANKVGANTTSVALTSNLLRDKLIIDATKAVGVNSEY
jgi:hypothetical protein